MKRIESSHPHRMEFESGGGCSFFFSIGLLLVGLAGATSPLWKEGAPSSMRVDVRFAVPLGIGMAVLGLIGIFVRMRVYIDKEARVVVSGWHALGLAKEKRRSFDEFTAVTIRRREQSSGSEKMRGSPYIYYPVVLTAGDGEVQVGRYISVPEEARSLAREVGEFMGLDVIDRSAEDEPSRDAP